MTREEFEKEVSRFGKNRTYVTLIIIKTDRGQHLTESWSVVGNGSSVSFSRLGSTPGEPHTKLPYSDIRSVQRIRC